MSWPCLGLSVVILRESVHMLSPLSHYLLLVVLGQSLMPVGWNTKNGQ